MNEWGTTAHEREILEFRAAVEERNHRAMRAALEATYEALAKPRPTPELLSECCGALAPRELDLHNIGRCTRCHEFCVFTDKEEEATHG